MAAGGLIDLHIHGMGRYDTQTSRAKDILGLAGLCVRAGVSALLPTLCSGPIKELRKGMAAIRGAMESPAPKGACKILGVHLEGPFLNPARCGAMDVDSMLKPTAGNVRSLLDGFEDIVRVITIAPELSDALVAIEKCAGLGIRVNMGHSDATYKQALEGKRAGATGVTHIFNAMRPFHHREPGLAGLGLMDNELYVEVIGDGVHLAPEALRLIFGIKRRERIILVSDSVKGPMRRKGVLQGGKTGLRDASRALGRMGIPQRSIKMATGENPRRYLS
jgi:N-acetylglucosamine-6-phosphate deacetylase